MLPQNHEKSFKKLTQILPSANFIPNPHLKIEIGEASCRRRRRHAGFLYATIQPPNFKIDCTICLFYVRIDYRRGKILGS
jgi:hypothetical protein